MAVAKLAFIINLLSRNSKFFCTNVSILKNRYFNLLKFILYACGEKNKRNGIHHMKAEKIQRAIY